MSGLSAEQVASAETKKCHQEGQFSRLFESGGLEGRLQLILSWREGINYFPVSEVRRSSCYGEVDDEDNAVPSQLEPGGKS